MIRQNINAPLTSSVGRLFDGVSAILGLCAQNTFEGEAAMALEFKAEKTFTDEFYPCNIDKEDTPEAVLIFDWRVMIQHLVTDVERGVDACVIARRFHNSLAECAVSCAKHFDRRVIVLSGGCFQNRILLERTIERLEEENFQPIWPQRLPPNDGGLALGQVYGAIHELSLEVASCA